MVGGSATNHVLSMMSTSGSEQRLAGSGERDRNIDRVVGRTHETRLKL